MEKRRRKRKKRKNILPVVFIILAVIAIIAGLLLYERYRPTKERADLYEYFGMTEADDVAVIRDLEQTEYFGKLVNSHVYLPYSVIRESINDRFYFDQENLLLYTDNSSELSYDLAAGGNDCLIRRFENGTVTEETKHYEAQPVLYLNDAFYLEMDFIKEFSPIEYTYYEEPSRIVLTTSFEERPAAYVEKNTVIRKRGGVKSPILKDLLPGDTVYLLSEEEEIPEGETEDGEEEKRQWRKVESPDGFTGYVQIKCLGEETTEQITCTYQEEEFTHLLYDGTVNLLWHQVTNQEGNSRIKNTLESTKGVNVVSPTWFTLKDDTGDVTDLGSLDYVNYCHEQGIKVWGLVSNLGENNANDEQVISHYGSRWNFINVMMEKAAAYQLDGINLDFEAIEIESGPSYVQLVREMSIACQNQGLVLSVDNYVPMDYNLFYDRGEQANYADYLVIMGYDEHYNGSDEGSVSSIPFVENGIKDTIAEGVPENQIILGMPFYTRIWQETPKSGASDLEMASEDYIPYELSSNAVGMELQNAEIARHNAEPVWIPELGQNFASWVEEGNTYKVWMEDEASLTGRLTLLKENNLAGGAFWKAGLEIASVWDIIAEYLQ